MKTKHLLALIISMLIAPILHAQSYSVSLEDALNMCKNQFTDQVVDYYLIEDEMDDHMWVIFIDAEPMKGWEHDCYLSIIPKESKVPMLGFIPPLSKGSMPPNVSMTPLLLQSNVNATNDIPDPLSNIWAPNSFIAHPDNHTYAIILSGGYNKNSNHERYWNDCQYIYQTLKRRYHIPQSNITVLMSDGTDPAPDMLKKNGYSISSPLDMDNDGIEDINYAATKSNIRMVIDDLYTKMVQDDQLFIFVIDHGGTTDNISKSHIYLWNEDRMTDSELAEYLTPLAEKGISINAVLGQCNSGGFIDDLSSIGCVVTAACKANESSWACSNMLYDEFVFHWTNAINEYLPLDVPITQWQNNTSEIDLDGDNHITMDEAFSYAESMDTRDETPQFYAGPGNYGENLAFDMLPKSDQIYIKDNDEDTGVEPNLTTEEFWKSPSIWVRNDNDGGLEHENPYYSNEHDMAYVYVKIHNRGGKIFKGKQWLHTYWALASAGLTPKAWRGKELYNDRQTGLSMGSKPIPTIMPGESIIMQRSWALPDYMDTYEEGEYHFCLYAKIMDHGTDDPFDEETTKFDPKSSNKEAQKNVSIIRRTDTNKQVRVFVRNVESSLSKYSLELVPETATDTRLFDLANIEMRMSPLIYSAWERGGMNGVEIEPLSNDQSSDNGNVIKLLSMNSKIQEVTMNSDEFDVIDMKFDFFDAETSFKTYTFDLIQRDENGKVIGGETFIVEAPIKALDPPIIITPDPPVGPYPLYSLRINDNGYTNINWFNGKGKNIGTSESITVDLNEDNENISVAALTEEGYLATGSITLDNVRGIKSVNILGGVAHVELVNIPSGNAWIEIVSTITGNIELTAPVQTNDTGIDINVSSISSGIYSVIYKINGSIIDTKKIIINK